MVFDRYLANSAPSTTASSSNRGIVCGFMGLLVFHVACLNFDLARLVHRSRYGVLVRNLDIFLLSDIDNLCGLIGGS